MAVRPGDDALYITERAGQILALRNGEKTTVLDQRDRTQHGGEEGMLGLTFSPDGSRLYVYYIDDAKRDSHVDEYTFNGDQLDLKSRREVLFVDQPDSTVHKGGQLAFGDDGMLYLSLGDGGPADVPPSTSQELDTLLGKIVRIDPTPDGDTPYTIPADNPFADDQSARGEIFALGLRNPWRFSFDRDTGDLWVPDVGRYILEEINVRSPGQAAGSNFGWPYFEGDSEQRGEAPKGLVKPLHQYLHEGRCAIIGGYVYRGPAIDDLRGAYVYGDYCDGQVRALVKKGGKVVQEEELGAEVAGMTSFGQDAAGELYVLTLDKGLFKIVPKG